MQPLIDTLIIVAIFIGIVHLCGAWPKVIAQAPRLLALKPYEGHPEGLADLLPWAMLVDSGIVQLKNGALLAGFYYQGRDIASASADERNQLTRLINRALMRLGTGWATWHDVIRVATPGYSPPELSRFPDWVTQAIDDERRAYFTAQGRNFQSIHAFTVMYTPPDPKTRKLTDAMYEEDASSSNQQTPADKALAEFKNALADLQSSLQGVIKISRMQSFFVTDGERRVLRDDLVNHLNLTLTGTRAPINLPETPMYLDAFLGLDDIWVGFPVKLGNTLIKCVSISGFPNSTYPNILRVLESLPELYRWSTRMIYLDKHHALEELNRSLRKWRGSQTSALSKIMKNTKATVNRDAVAMEEEVHGAITDAQSDLVGYGYYTSIIELRGQDAAALDERARLLEAQITQLGFAARVEQMNTMEAWLGSLPGHDRPNVRRPIMHTLNLADLLPLSHLWAGEEHNPCPFYKQPAPPLMYAATEGSTPFRLNLHHGDLGHTLVLGPTGAGKSTLLAFIAAQQRRYPDATVTAFDKGRSLFALASAVEDGIFYDLGSEDSPGLCPLQQLEHDVDMAWAEDWLAQCYQLQTMRPPTPEQRQAIRDALRLLKGDSGRSLTHFCGLVQDEAVKQALSYYKLLGPLGNMLDSTQDELHASQFCVFECEELMKMSPEAAAPILMYLFTRFERSLRGQPAILVLDEAWVMLQNPIFRPWIQKWLKELRKHNCAVVIATQSLSDARRSGIFDVLQESCPTKILLANAEADRKGSAEAPGPMDMYLSLGCDQNDIEIIKNLRPKAEYYYMSEDGRRQFDLKLGPIALAFTGVSDKPSIARIKALKKQHGHRWPLEWLNERGVHIDEAQKFFDRKVA